MRQLCLAICLWAPSFACGDSTHRLQDGITAFVHNAAGRDFTVQLTVRDINIYENGPRELLVKVYDPDGVPVVRKVIADDGVVSKAFLPPIGAWDHEAWYYAYCYMKGTQPMIRWSAFSAPDRLAAVAKRDFTLPIKGGKNGVYRILVVGCIDHYVTLRIDPPLTPFPSPPGGEGEGVRGYGVMGHPDWLHQVGQAFQPAKSFVYVPKGTRGFYACTAEYDVPRTRQVIIRGPDGQEIVRSKPGVLWMDKIEFADPSFFEDKLLSVEVSPGEGDFLLSLKLRLQADPEVTFRGERVAPALFAPDESTARALQGGAIYHDGKVFWHGFQVRFHDWLKKLSPADFDVKTADGKPGDPAPGYTKYAKGQERTPLPGRTGFIPLNGPYWRAPKSDVIMHNYPVHKNRAALNVALKDLAAGLRSIGPNDHASVAVGGAFANLAYEFGNYAWHYWRPAWRILQQSDAPAEVKDIVREAFLVAGDRLAFCRTWERVNGNSYAQVLSALRYCHAATGDLLQKELFDIYWDRFVSGGWGERVGVGPSGPVQEGFAYAYHYASYIVTTWQSIVADFPEDDRLKKVHDGVHRWFSYTLADENVAAGPWSARTKNYPHWKIETDGAFAWKGLPGPDFTESINDANEWFAARRPGYYALTYHGRLSPKWEANAHPGQSGYGGGMVCQLQIPGKGLAIASTLNGDYGEGMDPSQWRKFHLHTMVGTQADGTPFVAGDSEHFDARLDDKHTVVSSGDIRHTSLACRRSFAFGKEGIDCTVQLGETQYTELLNLWLKNNLRGKVREAYEMIPFLPQQRMKKAATLVLALDGAGKTLGPLGSEPIEAAGVLIDRGGFGVRIMLDKTRPVLRGENNTVLIRLADRVTAAKEFSLGYRLLPF